MSYICTYVYVHVHLFCLVLCYKLFIQKSGHIDKAKSQHNEHMLCLNTIIKNKAFRILIETQHQIMSVKNRKSRSMIMTAKGALGKVQVYCRIQL